MTPKLGDTVFVSERSEYDGLVTVSPALVTHVYTEQDGDPAWWQEASGKGIVDAIVFRRNGTFDNATVSKSEQVTVDDGLGGTVTYPVGYATSPDGHGNTSADPAVPFATPAAPTQASAAPAPTAQGLSDADVTRIAAAIRAAETSPADTQTVGDGADVATQGGNPSGGDVTGNVPGGFPA